MNDRVPLAWLVPLRLLVAIILIVEGWQKLTGGWLHGDEMMRVTATWLDAHKPFAFFLGITRTAHAHPKVFGAMITFGELVVGLCMLIGAFTRFAALVGVLLLGSIAAASGQRLAPPGNALLMAAIFATFVLIPPGRVLGVDQRLRGKMPSWMI